MSAKWRAGPERRHFYSLEILLMGDHMRLSRKVCFLMMIFSFFFCAHGAAAQYQGGQQEPGWQDNKRLSHSGGTLLITEDLLAGLSQKERKWYHRFQDGVPLFDGWKKITQAVVEKFPEHEREGRLAAMQALGFKIGHEWSRDNRVRKVNTEALRAWGQDLRQAGTQDHVQLADVLYKIDSEVNALLHME
jgi:hypothetical protein